MLDTKFSLKKLRQDLVLNSQTDRVWLEFASEYENQGILSVPGITGYKWSARIGRFYKDKIFFHSTDDWLKTGKNSTHTSADTFPVQWSLRMFKTKSVLVDITYVQKIVVLLMERRRKKYNLLIGVALESADSQTFAWILCGQTGNIFCQFNHYRTHFFPRHPTADSSDQIKNQTTIF